jgi:hypothetical protein
MNEISFAIPEFYIVLVALASMGLLVGLLRWTVLGFQRRKNLRLETVNKRSRRVQEVRSTWPPRRSVAGGGNQKRTHTRSGATSG